METVSLKMEKEFLDEIDNSLKKHRYTTRTEFIRDAIRSKLTEFEKEESIKRLSEMKGTLKSNISDEEAGELAFKKIAKKLE